MPKLTVAALLGGEPGPLELWTLRAMAEAGCELRAVQATLPPAPPWTRAAALARGQGPLKALSRLLGSAVGARIAARDAALLDELFDGEELRAWWRESGPAPAPVPALNHDRTRAALEALSPDVIVRVSGGILKPDVFSLARIAALNIHHGLAPLIRGMWSIPWGIIEGRRDWIGATIHVIDAGIDTGPVLWRGGPR
jgi:hypothetical protein